jgi:hypothetical protein
MVWYPYRPWRGGRFLSRDPLGEGGFEAVAQGRTKASNRGMRRLADAGNVYCFVGNNPVSLIDPLGLCKIEIRHAELGSICGLKWYHAYVVVTDTNNAQTYFRSGPAAGGPSSGGGSSATGGSSTQKCCCNSSRSQSSNSSNCSSPGCSPAGPGGNTGPWGRIEGDSGPYVAGTIDWDPNPSPTVVVLNDGQPCADYITKLQAALDAIDNANVPYNPFTDNSNATAYSIIEQAGFARPTPPVWAPGACRKLP